MQYNILALTLLTSAVSALPSTLDARNSHPSCRSVSKNANFDDLKGIPAVELNPIPVPYMGLDFQGFKFLTVVRTNLAPGVVPHSGTNYAFSNALTTTTGGSAEWTTNYAGSVVTKFTPESFYYGCAINLQNGATALPTACNIAITGFKKGDNTAEAVQVAAQQFSYNPSTMTGAQQMTKGTFRSSFKDIQYVLIQYTLPGGTALLNADLGLVVDDVKYTVCS